MGAVAAVDVEIDLADMLFVVAAGTVAMGLCVVAGMYSNYGD